MTQNFHSHHGLAMPNGGLASRRGGPSVKPLSFDALGQQSNRVESDVPTPRTSRSHLLAGLRTAPRSATATSFAPNATAQPYNRSNTGVNAHGTASNNLYNPPKTAYPQFGTSQNNLQQALAQQQLQQQLQMQLQMQQQQQQQQQQQYTVDQVLAPPDMSMEETTPEQMDPNMYAQLVATNLYLAQQQQRLQQQLRTVQAAAQQFQQLNINNSNATQQQMALFEQQQQLRALQQQLSMQNNISQNQQVFYNPLDGQYYFETPAVQQAVSPYSEQPATPFSPFVQNQQRQQQQLYQQQVPNTPRFQVSPPPETQQGPVSNAPVRREGSPQETQQLPTPSANAFRRGHKKAPSLAPINSALASSGGDAPKTGGLKTSMFPMTPGGYGPGQHRAGEHPVRQPRGPPNIEELKAKPTAKHDGSKNFAARTRRSAVHNLVRAGLERRKGTGSSNGSMSPVSESAEDTSTPITDNDSDSGRSGPGSLAGEMDSASSRTSASGNWGAIGSDRPSSRQKSRKSVESLKSAASAYDSDNSSFANVFKNGTLRAPKAQDSADQRKAARLVLTSAEKRRLGSNPVQGL